MKNDSKVICKGHCNFCGFYIEEVKLTALKTIKCNNCNEETEIKSYVELQLTETIKEPEISSIPKEENKNWFEDFFKLD